MRRRLPTFPIALLLAACGGSAGAGAVEATSTGEPLPEGSGYVEARVAESVFGGEVYVLEAGPSDGPAVVLVHGLGERASADFQPVLPGLAERHRVVAVDLPGFGRSSRGNRLYSPERYVASLAEVLRARVPGPFVLVGHSMGGAIAMLFAAMHPDRVSRLVLIDAAGILHRDAYTRFLVHAQIDGVLGSAVTTLMSPFARRAPDPHVLLSNETARSTFLGGDANRIAALALVLHDFGPALDGVRAPTLVLWGEDDQVAPVRTGRLLASRMAQAQLVVRADTGHVPMADAPEWVTEQIVRWLDAPAAMPVPDPAEPAGRIGRCEAQEDVSFEGAYERIELDRCRGAQLTGVFTRQLVARDSVATLTDVTVVGADGPGLRLEESVVRVTGGRIRAPVCVHLDASELDMAGTVLECGDAAFVAADRSKLVLSVLRVTSRRGHGYLHEVRVLDGGQSL